MISQSDEMTTVGAELDRLIPALQAAGERHPVVRSKHTEARAEIPSCDRRAVYARDGYRCVWCMKGGPNTRLTLDHVVPWSAGGTDHPDNLRTLCWDCNEQRSNCRTPDETWRPLPITYYCLYCHRDLQREFPNDLELQRPFPTDEPDVGPAFCVWHRCSTVGHRTTNSPNNQGAVLA